MSNELLFIIASIGIFGFILLAFMFGKRWLHAAIAANLICIGVFGAKLIPLFGSVTNVGNIFYAAVFFAGQLLVEHYGKREGQKSIWLGFSAVAFVILAGIFTNAYVGLPEVSGVTEAQRILFEFAPRVALASLVAYLLSQSANIFIYGYLREKREWHLWWRSIAGNFIGQALDSIVFFSIAFWGLVPMDILVNAMITGFMVKVGVGFLAPPLLYMSYKIKTRRGILAEEGEAILAGINEGLVMTDATGTIVMANKTMSDMLGLNVHEIIGKPIAEIIPLEEKDILSAAGTAYLIRKDQTRLPVRIVVVPVIIDSRSVGTVKIFYDRSGELEVEKLRMDFLSFASHQLRTPLTGTRWLIETLKKGLLGKMNKKQTEYIENLYRINNSMIELVSDMLNFLHLESSGKRLRDERFPIEKLFKEIISMMRPAAKHRSIELAQSPPIFITTDFNILKEIMESLVANAVNYSHEKQKITIGSREASDEVVLFVEDHGIGIPEDEQKRIFERFYRGSNAKLMKPDGTGLGLSIAKILAEKIGAHITFESEENKGSIFYVQIKK